MKLNRTDNVLLSYLEFVLLCFFSLCPNQVFVFVAPSPLDSRNRQPYTHFGGHVCSMTPMLGRDGIRKRTCYVMFGETAIQIKNVTFVKKYYMKELQADDLHVGFSRIIFICVLNYSLNNRVSSTAQNKTWLWWWDIKGAKISTTIGENCYRVHSTAQLVTVMGQEPTKRSRQTKICQLNSNLFPPLGFIYKNRLQQLWSSRRRFSPNRGSKSERGACACVE